ncbi:MAG: diphosphate--fructose-6-phosphate 1-phosphotransferase [bacterium]|nr:diphosphate--fructose-6-phosphate 1-phosphotransferase [bacterium]
MTVSPLTKERAKYRPKLPRVFEERGMYVKAVMGAATKAAGDAAEIKGLFAKTYGAPVVTFVGSRTAQLRKVHVGVILSGGQAPGGHNVIAGLFDALKAANKGNRLYGFLGGPSGVLSGSYRELTASVVNEYRNTGGFDVIGSGRTKLETEEQFEKTRETLERLNIGALVIVGGDDSNTNAALLAEYFAAKGVGIQVIGVPKTIDGDLKNEQIEASFGFDTAVKTYSELIGNICRDANSAKKYWHVIKLMGRSASHIALEAALQTHPNICIISEEVAAKKKTLGQIVREFADVVAARAGQGKNFGVALVPEGLIEFIPEIGQLISELNDLMAKEGEYFGTLETNDDRLQFVNQRLTAASSQVFSSLPRAIQMQLLLDRDPHGNVQVSRIETEKLLVDMVADELRRRKAEGTYQGKFSPQCHFFGYEGRCAAPSNFDADYCYSLGYTAGALIQAGVTGYMACIRNLAQPAKKWVAGGVPLTMMMNMERRHGKSKPVIKKALVDLNGAPFKAFAAVREKWAMEENYLNPGPIQYFGPASVCDAVTITLELERGGKRR